MVELEVELNLALIFVVEADESILFLHLGHCL